MIKSIFKNRNIQKIFQNYKNIPLYNFSFDSGKLKKQVAEYELKTLDLHQGNNEISEVVYDLTYQLEQETNYGPDEINLIIYLNLGDLNMRFKQKDAAQQGLSELVSHLEDYKEDLDLKSHLQPQAYHRLGAIAVQDGDFELGGKYYQKVIDLIEEEAKSSGDKPISIDIIKLLSNASEKLGNVKRNLQDLEGAVEQYYRSYEINNQAFPPTHPFSLKVQTFLGDTLRKLEKNKESLFFLENVINNLKIENQKDSSLYVIASQSLIMAHLNMENIEKAESVIDQTAPVYEANKQLIPALSFAGYHHTQAITYKALNKLDKARECLAIAISLAEGVLPEDHQVLKQYKSFKI